MYYKVCQLWVHEKIGSKIHVFQKNICPLFITKFAKHPGWVHAIPSACNILIFLLHVSQESIEPDCEVHQRRHFTELTPSSYALCGYFLLLLDSVRVAQQACPPLQMPMSCPGARCFTTSDPRAPGEACRNDRLTNALSIPSKTIYTSGDYCI